MGQRNLTDAIARITLTGVSRKRVPVDRRARVPSHEEANGERVKDQFGDVAERHSRGRPIDRLMAEGARR